ncbi:hypothetical protein M127_5086 [Bacteroides fragilis str. S6L5]|nr:hypothetical protein M127_5086 [Bacteroides fragilis str. S6L5]
MFLAYLGTSSPRSESKLGSFVTRLYILHRDHFKEYFLENLLTTSGVLSFFG